MSHFYEAMQGLSQEAPFKYRNAGAKLNPLPNLPTYSYTVKNLRLL